MTGPRGSFSSVLALYGPLVSGDVRITDFGDVVTEGEDLEAGQAAAATGKLRLLDVVELNPSLDPDGRMARTAARLIDEAVRTLFEARAWSTRPVRPTCRPARPCG